MKMDYYSDAAVSTRCLRLVNLAAPRSKKVMIRPKADAVCATSRPDTEARILLEDLVDGSENLERSRRLDGCAVRITLSSGLSGRSTRHSSVFCCQSPLQIELKERPGGLVGLR